MTELAAGSGLSAGHFVKQFKRSTGLSPYQYILCARVGRAQHLLAQGVTPIAESASACGFADQEHFTKVFKRLTGATPATYRNDRRS
ncbi:helix-turn-helix domain-containing protein [Bradyrhizobium sp. USDA 10063]